MVFLSTTGDVLNDEQQVAFEKYIESGGGFVGVHTAADTEYGWNWHGRFVGGYFDGHPTPQMATLKVVNHTFAGTQDLPDHLEAKR